MTCLDPWWHDRQPCDGSCVESSLAATVSGRRVVGESDTCSIELGTSEAARRANVERPLDPHLDSTESRPDVSVSAPPSTSLRTAALDLLAAHRAAMDREKRTRLYLIACARDHGVTNQEIGDALGMTEGGVRRLVQRSENT